MGKNTLACGIVGLFLLAATGSSARPHFDCSKAAYPDEEAICNNDDLARMDRLGDEAFTTLFLHPESASAASEARDRFIAARRECGSDIGCIQREQSAFLVSLATLSHPNSQAPDDAPWRVIGLVLLCSALGAGVLAWRNTLQAKWAAASQSLGASAATGQRPHELRRAPRRSTRFRTGKLLDANNRLLTECTICDRSQGGARVRTSTTLEPRRFIRFHDDVEGLTVDAKVAWRRGNELGLEFWKA